MSKSFSINMRRIDSQSKTYVVAELSANHGQDIGKALELVRAAHEAGADAVKLQTYTPDSMTIASDKEYFRIGGGTLWDGRTLYDLYGEAYTPWEWHAELQREAHALGLDFFSTAFDDTAVDFLEELDVPVHKVASFELVDIPLIEKMAQTGKPLILSTGMATFEEIREAVDAARNAGAEQILLLKCTSAYPAPPEAMNLRTIPHMAEQFGAPVGLSDHTPGIAVPVAAVTMGACMVEKHFTLRRSDGGPDSAFSLEPHEFREMVQAIRVAEKALGTVHYGATGEDANGLAYRRSLFVVRDVAEGEVLTGENVRSIRPGYGLAPKHLARVLGKRAARAIERGTPLEWEMIEQNGGETGRPNPAPRSQPGGEAGEPQAQSKSADALPAQLDALVMDFDGVMTDNRVLVTQEGQEAVWCNRSDGARFGELRARGIALLILSQETNAVVEARANKLRVECLAGIDDKRTALEKWLGERGLDAGNVVYVGNDLNDLECMRYVGCGAAVADAYPEVKRAAALALTRKGGDGAVREVCDLILGRKRDD